MDQKTLTELSKFLSFVLRHQPEAIGVVLDPHGWIEIEQLVEGCRAHGDRGGVKVIHLAA